MAGSIWCSNRIVWPVGILSVVGLPVTSWLYWPRVLEAGVLPPEGDTILIPMVNSVVLACLLLPLVLCITWLCVRGRTGPIDLLAWRHDRPVASVAATIGWAVPTGYGLLLVEEQLTAPVGWFGPMWLPYTAIVLLWLTAMRESVLRPRHLRPTVA